MELYKTPCNDSWGYDQFITTYGILKHKLCTLPNNNGLWRIPGLVAKHLYHPYMDDSEICWHGKDYTDCNQDTQHVKGGCKWWHFYPNHNLAVHIKKFRELTNGIYNSNISSLYFNIKSLDV